MAASTSANVVCSRIHDFIQASGLHYIINQTPWSSYITIRKKFVHSDGLVSDHVEHDDTQTILAENKQLKEKLVKIDLDVVTTEEETKVANHQHQKIVDSLHLKIETQEYNIKALEKDKKVKDGIIKNLNDGFNEKINNLNAKIEHLEDVNREVMKKEKKALKKQRQKSQKQKADNTNVGHADESFKDGNENILERIDSSLDNSLQLFTPVRMKIGSPPRRAPCTSSTPLTPYTPPGLPTCFTSKSEHFLPTLIIQDQMTTLIQGHLM